MSVRTQQSLTGYIASDPQLTFTSQGDARFYARVGQEQFRRLDDGTFERTGVEYTDLIQYRKAAEHAYAQFRKGDSFVAEGYAHQYQRTLEDGTVEHREEFVAKKLGHDAARTAYAVDRAPQPNQTAALVPAVLGREATPPPVPAISASTRAVTPTLAL